jgi:hypothetical protein
MRKILSVLTTVLGYAFGLYLLSTNVILCYYWWKHVKAHDGFLRDRLIVRFVRAYPRIVPLMGISVLLFCLVGCVSDEANRYYLRERLPPKNVKDVEVLREEPNRPYVVIADLQASGASFEYMRKKAARIGADAVILVPIGGWYSPGEVWAGKDRHSDTYTRLTGTAIKYKTQ